MEPIRAPEDFASLIADPTPLHRALAVLEALEKLELVIVVNGVPARGTIQLADGSAILSVTLPDA